MRSPVTGSAELAMALRTAFTALVVRLIIGHPGADRDDFPKAYGKACAIP
jgi:hypothetical protein